MSQSLRAPIKLLKVGREELLSLVLEGHWPVVVIAQQFNRQSQESHPVPIGYEIQLIIGGHSVRKLARSRSLSSLGLDLVSLEPDACLQRLANSQLESLAGI